MVIPTANVKLRHIHQATLPTIGTSVASSKLSSELRVLESTDPHGRCLLLLVHAAVWYNTGNGELAIRLCSEVFFGLSSYPDL